MYKNMADNWSQLYSKHSGSAPTMDDSAYAKVYRGAASESFAVPFTQWLSYNQTNEALKASVKARTAKGITPLAAADKNTLRCISEGDAYTASGASAAVVTFMKDNKKWGKTARKLEFGRVAKIDQAG